PPIAVLVEGERLRPAVVLPPHVAQAIGQDLLRLLLADALCLTPDCLHRLLAIGVPAPDAPHCPALPGVPHHAPASHPAPPRRPPRSRARARPCGKDDGP